ncbi:conserved protein of unknown function [Candidatus Promineifilum breve]|uniref:DUF4337 domain-containing protein n=1 Tax=Candidatus Promineifilum breve TaxID=1806508 RepID=A0A160T2T3_9CHLR|nr:hypothetical protein [Candidatus Promineifilum breve]CUS03218.2 conserved protein of unknown function [Candidatus Promineifilum breve]
MDDQVAPPEPSPGAKTQQKVGAASRYAKWRRPEPSPEYLQDRRIHRRAELWETIVVTLATLATVWAGYQAGNWNSAQTVIGNRALSLRVESSQLSTRGYQSRAIDVGLFADWISAYAVGDTRVADFLRARFRDEFRPAFDAWLSEDPFADVDAPDTPFDMPEYRVAALVEAAAKLEDAENFGRQAEMSGNIGDQYTLSVVILAASLLLAGIANRFEWAELRAVVVGAALIVLLYCVINIIRLPVF